MIEMIQQTDERAPSERVPGEAQVLAEQLRAIYENFDICLSNLSYGDSVGEVFGNNILGWLGTGKYKQGREKICNDFSAGVKTQVEKLRTALEFTSLEEAQRACARAAEIMLNPVSSASTESGDLMRRAVAPYLSPILPWFDRENLKQIYQNFLDTYPKRTRFPAEKKFIRAMEEQLNG